MGSSGPWFDVRRVAALDIALHGRWLITSEFALGALACLVLGWATFARGLALLPATPAAILVCLLGVVLLGGGLNYLPLLAHAIDLGRRGSWRELAAPDLASKEAIRRYSLRQFILFVPGAVLFMAVAQGRPRPRRPA